MNSPNYLFNFVKCFQSVVKLSTVRSLMKDEQNAGLTVETILLLIVMESYELTECRTYGQWYVTALFVRRRPEDCRPRCPVRTNCNTIMSKFIRPAYNLLLVHLLYYCTQNGYEMPRK